MAELHLFRGIEIINYFRDYRIYLDDQYIGKLGRKEELKIPIEPGRHSFQAKIDWCTSQYYEFTVSEDQQVVLEVCTSRTFEKSFLILFFIHVLFILFNHHFDYAQQITLLSSAGLLLLLGLYYTKYRAKYLWIYRIEPI